MFSYFARRIIFIYYSKCLRMVYRHNKLNNLIRISHFSELRTETHSLSLFVWRGVGDETWNFCAMAFLIEISTFVYMNYWSLNLVLRGKSKNDNDDLPFLSRSNLKSVKNRWASVVKLFISCFSCITFDCERNKSCKSDTLIMEFPRKCRTCM